MNDPEKMLGDSKKDSLRFCDRDFNPCPCKVTELDNEIEYCNFVFTFAIMQIAGEIEKSERLLKKVCPEVREEIQHQNEVARNFQKAKKQFLEKVQPGNIVYCMSEFEDVVFLEKNVNAHGDCKYKNIEGKIKTAPNFCFRIISQGKKFADFKVKDSSKLREYIIKAKRNGFRPEKKDLRDATLLRIYGDAQKEVDDFVECLKNDLVFYYFE